MIMLCVGGPMHGEEIDTPAPTYIVWQASPRGPRKGRYIAASVYNDPEAASLLVAGLWGGWDTDRVPY